MKYFEVVLHKVCWIGVKAETADEDTYESALEAGLQKCLTLLIEKQ